MKNTNKLLVFAAGAVVGSVATWFLTKEYYKRIADEEIESMEEYYSRRNAVDEEEDEAINVEEDEDGVRFTLTGVKPNIVEYVNRVNNYTSYSSASKLEDMQMEDVERPYVISPEEFGELDGYATLSLTYYADDVLTDEDGDVIDNVDAVIGRDTLKTFGKYEDDSVFVRDDSKKLDYEILADSRKFSEVFGYDAHPAEGR